VDRPEIIAHRGTPRTHPENSLPGFRYALDLGADAIELDVHLTADGVVVVHHDAFLHRGAPAASGHRPAIRELTATELAAHPLAPGVPVPTLAAVLGLVADRAVVYVEVKAPEAELAALRCISESRTSCAIHGFDHRVALRVATMRDRDEHSVGSRLQVPTGILSASYLIDPAAALRAARARDYWQQWEMIDDDLMSRIHDAGGRVIAWTVNEASEAERLAAMGVDGICTDVCGELVEHFGI
jgi:glycerophosphoryl diester phosphodiesterase